MKTTCRARAEPQCTGKNRDLSLGPSERTGNPIFIGISSVEQWPDLSRLPGLIEHSRRALPIIHQNILFSLAVKAVFVILTFAGAASLWADIAAAIAAAIAADMGGIVNRDLDGLRLLRG